MFDTNKLELSLYNIADKTNIKLIVKYKVMFAIDKWKSKKIGAFRLIKSLISNWSKGLLIYIILFTKSYVYYYLH